MRKLGTHAIAGAVLVTLAVGAPAASAQAPAPVQAGTSTTVKADCFVGPGSISLRQVRQESGATLVDVAGHDVRNGLWRGVVSVRPNSDDPDDEIMVRTTATGREFRKSFEVDDASRSSELTMVSGRKHVCGIYLSNRPKSMFLGNPKLTFFARYPEPGEMTTRVFLAGCQNGSRWRYSTELTYADHVVGMDANGFECRDGMVRIPKSSISAGGHDERPSAIKVVARSSIGQVRHLSYSTSTPDSTEGRS